MEIQTHASFHAARLRLTALDLAVKRSARNPPPSTVDNLGLMTHGKLMPPQRPAPGTVPFVPVPCHLDGADQVLLSPQGTCLVGLRALGQGDGGAVFLATLQGAHGGRLVALKEVRLKATDGANRFMLPQQALDRAMQEYEIMRICRSALTPVEMFLSRGGKQGDYGNLYAVMPPMRGDGVDITNELRIHAAKVLPLWGRHVMGFVLRALVRIHERHFLHADVKPENILLDFEGIPHLADFGFAASIAAKQARRGSLEFVAPEVLWAPCHRDAGFDDRADVYSTAVTVLAMLVRNPLEGDSFTMKEWEADELRRDLDAWLTEEREGSHIFVRGRRVSARRELAELMEKARKLAPTLFPLLVRMLATKPEERLRAKDALAAFEALALDLTVQERAQLNRSLLKVPQPPPERAIAAAMLKPPAAA